MHEATRRVARLQTELVETRDTARSMVSRGLRLIEHSVALRRASDRSVREGNDADARRFGTQRAQLRYAVKRIEQKVETLLQLAELLERAIDIEKK